MNFAPKRKGEPMSDLIDNGGYRFWDDDFSIQSAYEDCKAVFDGITDDDAFQECDTGIILYHAHEIMYALKKALPSAQPNACENTCEIERKSNDMISRQAAIDAHCELCADKDKCNHIETCPDVEVFRLIPSAEPKKGKWIKRDSYDRRDNFYSCSICGRMVNIICGAHLEDYPFCHCGADMRGEQDE